MLVGTAWKVHVIHRASPCVEKVTQVLSGLLKFVHGVEYLTGENLKVVLDMFSTLS